MAGNPLVSVIVPCYNHERFLDDCFMGIIQQDYTNIELIICDDCSTDKSFEKIKEYEVKLKEVLQNVIILRNEKNLGITKTLNRILLLAEGEFVKIIASDDVMVHNAISTMVSYFMNNDKTDVVVANGIKITEEQHYPQYELGMKIYKEAPDLTSENLFVRTYIHNDIFAPGVMIRKSIYEQYGCYDEKIEIEDLEFWLRILKEGKTVFSYIDKELIYYRINSCSMTSLTNNKSLEQRRKKFHKSEMQILHKYGSYVGKNIYAETIILRIINEKSFAVRNKLYELLKVVEEEYREFDLWANISFKKGVFFRYISLRIGIKKMIMVRGKVILK